MKTWKRIKEIDGLYLHLNGKYYIRRNYPKRSYHSLRTEDFKEAKSRIKAFVDSHRKVGITKQLPSGMLLRSSLKRN